MIVANGWGCMTSRIDLRRVLLSLATLLLPTGLSAVTIDKANNNTDLDQTGSWVGGVLPTNADIVRWNTTVTGPNTVIVSSSSTNLFYGGLIVADPAGPVTISGPGAVTVGASGIDMSAATQDLTIHSGFGMSANQPWILAAGRTLTMDG
jgi:hypothetical protein